MRPKKRKPVYKTSKKDFDIEQTLLKNRQIFLNDGVHEESSEKIIKTLYALDTINHSPIMLYVNSPGGSCSDGMAIINTMKTIESPVVTIINEEVCSMGSHISVAGDKRVCYENSVWMAHDMSVYMEDYSGKVKDRAKFWEEYYDNVLNENYRLHTDLSEQELKKARDGELWLFADTMLEKGIVDEIIVLDEK